MTSRAQIPIERQAQRRLLAILLFESGRRLDTDLLIDRFWGEEPPATARAALQTHLSQLRRRLGEGIVTTTAAGYRLELQGHELDAVEFDDLAEAARTAYERAAWAEVGDHAAAALARWRGRPFVELQDDDFATPEIARLEELRAELIEMRAEAQLALGRNEEALPDLERFVEEYPERERIWQHLMLARARQGRVSEALAAYHQARARFDEMGLEPGPALRELEERILREDPALVPPRIRHNLPARLTSFVGRDLERRELPELLAAHRLVTLTGVGGVGKTRLALQAAEDLLDRFPDGIWMMDLAGISDPDLVANEVAVMLGLRAERQSIGEALTESLRGRTLLVVLDNCEHLLQATARLAELLLAAGPKVSVLTTSREALGMAGELVYSVPPLTTPEAYADDETTLVGYDAIRLFADRAALASRGFTITSENAATVASICRRLDGLPLAIELAAARMNALSPEDVADRLDNRFRLLARSQPVSPARHQTLEATVAWSYEHLADAERALFTHLAAFNGSFTLEMVEAICTDARVPQSQVAAVLAGLIDKSLVVALETEGGRRYRLLETIRDYARSLLDATGTADEIRRRHRDWFLELSGEAQAHQDDSSQLAWLNRFETERENLQAALDWSLQAGDGAQVARLADALAWYRAKHGQFGQAIADLRTALDHLEPDPEREAALRVRLAGTLYSTGDEHAALEEASRARALVADAEPSVMKVRALTEYADLHLRIVQEDPEQVIGPAREAAVAARVIGDRSAEVRALRMLGSAMTSAGQVDEGVAHLREALAIAKEVGAPVGILGVYLRLCIALVDFAGDDRAAAELADEVLEWLAGGGDRWGNAASLLMWTSYGFVKSGDWTRAEEVLDRSAGFHLEGSLRASLHSLRAILRWMQGRLEEAELELTDLRRAARASRYYRILYPLAADIRADQGDLRGVRALADEHMAAEVRPAEEATKLGTLWAVVRAEVAAAASPTGAEGEQHASGARAGLEQMRQVLARFPPRVLAGLRLETPDTYLALAEAELSRIAAPAPERWLAVLDRASYVYWRVYARCRLAESLLAMGRREEGLAELRASMAQASRLGAPLLRDEIETVGRHAGLGALISPSGRRRPPGHTSP